MCSRSTNNKGATRTTGRCRSQVQRGLFNGLTGLTPNSAGHNLPAPLPKTDCNNCQNKHNGSCKQLCEDLQQLLSMDQAGPGRAEYTNQHDIDAGKKPVDVPSGPDYSDLLKVRHLYTAKELAVLLLIQQRQERSEICRILAVSSPRVSQLIGQAKDRYEDFIARSRVKMAEELKMRSIPQEEGPVE